MSAVSGSGAGANDALPEFDAGSRESDDGASSPPPARPALLDLKAQWARMTSDQKLHAKRIGVAVSIAALGYGLYTASTSDGPPVEAAPASSKLDMGAGLRGDSLEVKLRGDLQKVLEGQTLLGERVTAIEEGRIESGRIADPSPLLAGGTPDLPPAFPGDVPAYPPTPGGAAGDGATLPPPPAMPRHRRRHPHHRSNARSARSGQRRHLRCPMGLRSRMARPEAQKKSCGRSICRLVS